MSKRVRLTVPFILVGMVVLLVSAFLVYQRDEGHTVTRGASPIASSTAERASCTARAGGDRWGPSKGHTYRRTADYGRVGNGWFTEIRTVERADDTLYVYDAREGTITVLDRDLDLVRRIGHRGHGPGELSGMLMMASGQRHYLEVRDSLVYVYDSRALNTFSRDGRFLRYEHLIPRSLSPLAIVGIHATGSELLFAVDSLAAGAGKRHLQVWSAPLDDGGPPRLVFETALRPPPAAGGVVYYGPTQPRPVWTVDGQCLFVSDGESDRVLRYAMDSRAVDTLVLPHYDVKPPKRTADRSRASAMISGMVAARTGKSPSSTALPDLEATGVWRWTDMIVDPDGYLWIELWREESDDEHPIDVYRVNIETGTVVKDAVPAFPVAFGPPGVYYGEARDASTDETYIARYTLGDAH